MKFFGHMRPTRDGDGNITGEQSSPVKARTIDPLGGNYGPDRAKRLIVTLAAGDVINVRPERTQRAESITAKDLYAYLLRVKAQKGLMEKARAAKVRKQERLSRERIARADRRMTRPLA